METILKNTLTRSLGDTVREGEALGRYIEENYASLEEGKVVFVALYGDLGAGKTAFVSGLASFFAPGCEVSSPTYAIVNEYEGKRKVVHYDMYRISSEDDLESTGFYDYKNCIVAAEWSENVPYALPGKYIRVKVGKTDAENERRICVGLVSADGNCL